MTSRRQAREEALQLLYAFEFTGKPVTDLLEDSTIIHDDGSDFCSFVSDLINKVTKSQKDADKLIESHAKNWSFSRIAILDRLILRMAITEFLGFPDIPPKVSIDEAIELGKKFSTGKSGRFINGMLDSILNELIRKKNILKNFEIVTSEMNKAGKGNRK